MTTPPPLKLSQPDVQAFIEDAPTPSRTSRTPPSSAVADPAAPKRGHVLQASGRVVRRLVVNVEPDIGAELERRRAESGASLSRIAGDVLRAALGL